jgi:hypothetical protein
MTEGSGTPASSESAGPAGSPEASLVGVMPEVVKGLKDKPPLLFGIGAGVILVVVLGVTADVWLVLIVAAVLVLALGAWLVVEARRLRAEAGGNGGVNSTIRGKKWKVGKGGKVRNVRSGGKPVTESVTIDELEVGDNAEVLNIDAGGGHEEKE